MKLIKIHISDLSSLNTDLESIFKERERERERERDQKTDEEGKKGREKGRQWERMGGVEGREKRRGKEKRGEVGREGERKESARGHSLGTSAPGFVFWFGHWSMIKPKTACLKRRGKLITSDKAVALGTTIQNYLWQLLPCDKLKLYSWIWNLDVPGLWTIGFTNGLYSYFAKFHGIPLSQCLYYFISSVPLFQDRSRDSSHFLWHPVSILIKAQVIQYHGQLLASQSREGLPTWGLALLS